MDVNTKAISVTDHNNSGAVENWVDSLYIDRHPTFDTSGKVAISDITTGDWARLAVGINSITPAASDQSQQLSDYASEGHTETVVTGKNVTLAVAGNRYVGNPGQEYVSSMWLKMGNAVKSRCIYVVNGQAIETGCTITAIVPTGGTANQAQTFSCTVNFDGVPVIPDGMLTLTEQTEAGVYKAAVGEMPSTTDPSKNAGRMTDVTIVSLNDQATSHLTQGGSGSSSFGNTVAPVGGSGSSTSGSGTSTSSTSVTSNS